MKQCSLCNAEMVFSPVIEIYSENFAGKPIYRNRNTYENHESEAWFCPNCGKVELMAVPQEMEKAKPVRNTHRPQKQKEAIHEPLHLNLEELTAVALIIRMESAQKSYVSFEQLNCYATAVVNRLEQIYGYQVILDIGPHSQEQLFNSPLFCFYRDHGKMAGVQTSRQITPADLWNTCCREFFQFPGIVISELQGKAAMAALGI